VSPVDPDDFDWEDSTAGSEVRRIVESATVADGRSPVDEATLLGLRHRGLDGARLYLAELSGFALVVEGAEQTSLDVVVAPDARRQGVGADLVDVALRDTDEPVVAWSHGNHPAAAALAAAFGFARVRDLWVMRRVMAQELPPVPSREDVVVRTFVPGQDEDAFWRSTRLPSPITPSRAT
jgi:mycothiol synthase